MAITLVNCFDVPAGREEEFFTPTEHFHAAHDAGFRVLVNKPEWTSFTSRPGLYEVVHQG